MLWFVKDSFTGVKKKAYENDVVDEEGAQILNLLIGRLAGVRKNGIKPCVHIRGEVDWYESSSDPTNEFFHEIIVRDDNANLCNDDLRQAWYQFTGQQLPPQNNKLGSAMHEHGYEPTEIGKRWTKGTETMVKRGYRGVRIRDEYLNREPWTMKQK